MWLNTLLLALREIRRNLLRSFLTMLGIVIGVSAVITMVTLGNGATRSVQAQIASLGSNLLMVMPGQRLGPGGGGGPPFAAADVEAIASQIGGVRLVAPEVRSSATLVANGRNWSAQVTGSTQNWFSVANWTIASGRGFEPDEERVGAAVCVIGATVRKELFGRPPATTNPAYGPTNAPGARRGARCGRESSAQLSTRSNPARTRCIARAAREQRGRGTVQPATLPGTRGYGMRTAFFFIAKLAILMSGIFYRL